jgi:signal transduction histidine kinase
MAALAYATAAALARAPAGELTTYRAGSGAAATVDLVAGFGLIVAGLATIRGRNGSALGPLAVLAGVAWFGPDWVGWAGAPEFVRVAGLAIAPFAFALITHLVVVSAGSVRGRLRASIVALYVVMASVGVGGLLFRDPYVEVNCWHTCDPNPLLVHSAPALASALTTAERVCWLVVGAALAVLCAGRLARARAPARRLLWALQLAGLVVGAAWAFSGGVLLFGPVENPSVPADAAAFLARAGAIITLVAALALSLRETRRRRLAVARLAVAPAPGGLRTVLAEAIADPELQIAYRIGDAERYVDADGDPVQAAAPPPGRVATPILRGGRELARVVHDGRPLRLTELEDELGAAARLAIENEALSAAVLAQMHDLGASRERIVETGDAKRRSLERDLHDGAQQRMLALSYDLRMACAAASDRDDLRALLELACAEAQRSLELLRELAHGIYPAVLGEAGLEAALCTLADQAPIAVELDIAVRDRLGPAVETAAYLTVREVVGECARAGATFVLLRARRDAHELVIEIEHDCTASVGTRLAVADRVATLGGRLEPGPNGVRAVIPCA